MTPTQLPGRVGARRRSFGRTSCGGRAPTIAACLLSVGMAACSSSDAKAGRGTSSETRPLPTTSASCSFPVESPAVQIVLHSNRRALVATWTLTGPLDARTASVLTVHLGRRYELGFQRVGSDVSRFVFDTRTRQQTNLLDPFTDRPDRAVLTVPAADISRLPGPVPWSATVSVDGNQVARCPPVGTTLIFPPTTRKSTP